MTINIVVAMLLWHTRDGRNGTPDATRLFWPEYSDCEIAADLRKQLPS
jgi:hypothetical protein